jgi:hypothetical protein
MDDMYADNDDMHKNTRNKVIDALIQYLEDVAAEEMAPIKSSLVVVAKPKKEEQVKEKPKEEMPKSEDAEDMFKELLKKKKDRDIQDQMD